MDDEPSDIDTLHARIGAYLGASEYIRAFDLAQGGVEDHPGDVKLRHAGVLALARMGATDRAASLFQRWGLDRLVDNEDVLALQARLLKDKSLATHGAGRSGALLLAAEAYEHAYRNGGQGYFPAINVGSLRLLGGDVQGAAHWARTAAERAASGDDYYSKATLAEASVILGEVEDAARHLRTAISAPGATPAALATTRRQLSQLVEHQRLDPALLDPLVPPKIAHFCGHRPAQDGAGGRFPEREISRVRDEIAEILDREDVRFGVGSLAAGADTLVAEALLEREGQVEIVLPFAKDEFIEMSVRVPGRDWVDRFEAVLDRAAAIHFVTEDAYLGHDELFNYATHLALGQARLRAERNGAELCQIAVWDGQPPREGDVAGTVFDLAKGRQMQLAQHIVRSRGSSELHELPSSAVAAPGARTRRALIFGDLKGFSRLNDEQLPIYVDRVLGVCAEVLSRYETHMNFCNTWGDGLFIVFNDIGAAADCAFDLRDAVAGIDPEAAGLPEDFGLRLGMHYGPVFETRDPVLGRLNYFGFHVSKAARVEPITPEGEVYVTDAAAAALAVDCWDRYRTDYVGRVPLAKGYGTFPMYALARRGD